MAEVTTTPPPATRDEALERLQHIRQQFAVIDRDAKKLAELDRDLKGFEKAYAELSKADATTESEVTNFARFLANRARKDNVSLQEAFKATVGQINKNKQTVSAQKQRLNAIIRKETAGWYPESYLDPECLDFVIKELEEYRADSVKQAIQHLNKIVDNTPYSTVLYEASPPKNQGLALAAFVINTIVTVIAVIIEIIYLFVAFGLGVVSIGHAVSAVFIPFFAILLLLPLCWMIPMTLYSYKIYKGLAPNTLVFAICDLLFLNLISGILLIVMGESQE